MKNDNKSFIYGYYLMRFYRKIPNAMKLSFLFLLISMMSFTVSASAQRVSISASNTKMETVLESITRQTGMSVAYSNDVVDLNRLVNVNMNNVEVRKALDKLLDGTSITYEIRNGKIYLYEKRAGNAVPSVNQQQQRITGTIADSKGEPLIGANVLVKGTTIGTVTDLDGKFTIEAPANATLVFSYIGYLSQELRATSAPMKITLKDDSQALEEVVVVGYGVQKKSVVTGAISSVKSEDMMNSTNTRPEQALQGKTSGVQVVSSSGAPGSSVKIRIRGYSSNGNSDPLYIVDGLRTTDISGLEPTNIESMEVLKDGASAAIYGAEGGNGVVLITTKNGSAGKSTVSYDFQYTIQSLGHTPKVMNAKQYMGYMQESGALSTITDPGYDTDWIKESFESAPMQKHNVSISGGNEKTTYLMSLTYLDQQGIVKGDADNYKRYSGMFNGSQKVNNWFKAGSSIQLNRYVRHSFNENDEYRGVLANSILMDPLTPVVYTSASQIPTSVQNGINAGKKYLMDDNGNYYGVSQFVNGETINPFVQMKQAQTTTTNTSFMGNVYADITPFKGFTFTSKLGVNYFQNNVHVYKPQYYYSGEMLNNLASVSEADGTNAYWQWENYATYNKQFGKHNLTLMAGTAASRNDYKTVTASGYPLIKDQESYADLAYISTQANSKVGGTTLTTTKMSYYGRVNYDYNGTYMLEATLRRDAAGLSILPKSQRWGTFPAVSAGWMISNEEFFPKNTPISSLKLRGSWGENGSLSNLSNYSYAATIQSSGSMLNYLAWSMVNSSYGYPQADGTIAQASFPTVLGNYNLTWETSRQLDLGFDLRLFNSRLAVTADYFRKKTVDLITTNTPPIEAGNSASPINGGDVLNKGVDLELSWRDHIGGLQYSISANGSFLKNEVTYLDPSIARISGATVNNQWTATAFEKGYPVWYMRGYKTNGIDPTTGDIKIVDVNGDGSITTSDYTQIGSAIPDFTYGATLNLEYKNFDFTCFIQGEVGNDVLMGMLRTDRATTNKLSLFYTDRWTKDNTNAKRPAANVNQKYWNSDQMVFDGSFLKVKQIQLGYTLPKNLMSKLSMSKTRIYASLDDFFTFTKYPGMDPESASTVNNSIGIDRGFFPISKKVMFGLSVNF